MIEKTCEFCKKIYCVSPSRKDKTRFCSGSCRNRVLKTGSQARKWNGGKIHFSCNQCGKNVVRRRGSGTYRFCSPKCHNVHRQKRESVFCQNCEKVFTRKKSKSKRYPREYCSFSCYVSYAVGEKSLQWRGGDKKYPITFNKVFKDEIRKRDKYTCAICRKPGNSVHHINYVKNDTVPENCITLCRSCHCKTNFHRESWIAFFRRPE